MLHAVQVPMATIRGCDVLDRLGGSQWWVLSAYSPVGQKGAGQWACVCGKSDRKGRGR